MMSLGAYFNVHREGNMEVKQSATLLSQKGKRKSPWRPGQELSNSLKKRQPRFSNSKKQIKISCVLRIPESFHSCARIPSTVFITTISPMVYGHICGCFYSASWFLKIIVLILPTNVCH